MASLSQQELQQQQAQVSGMFAQLPPEQQAQIQEVVGAYSQQLQVQGVAPEAVQSYVWSYYTQCVSSFYQQLLASRESEKAQQEAKLAPRESREELKALQRELDEELKEVQPPQQESPKHVPKTTPATEQAPIEQQAQPATSLQQETAVEELSARPNFVDPQQNAQKHFEQKIDPALAKRFAKQREKENIPDQELVMEETRHAVEQKMDPVLAKRFAKQREKEDTLESAVDEVRSGTTGHSASPTGSSNMDPVLAKRWNAMQERQSTGEEAVKSIEDAVSKQRQDKSKEKDSELAKRWAKLNESPLGDKDLYEPKKAEGVPPAATELAKRIEKQQEKMQERVEKFGDNAETAFEAVAPKPWEARQAAAQAAASSELASRLAKQQEKEKLAVEGAVSQSEAKAEVSEQLEADRKRFEIRAGKTETHEFKWRATSTRISWHAVVLEGLDAELEVTAVLQPKEGSQVESIVLQKNARGETFEGTFAPQRDRRLVIAADPASEGDAQSRCHREVQAVIFKFNNGFSWFNAKDIELVIVPSE